MRSRLLTFVRPALFVGAALVTALGCREGSPAPTAPLPDDGTRVLFIGNSLTSTNNLPDMLERLAVLGGGAEIVTMNVSFGGFALEDHWNNGTAARALSEHRWDFVVMQQGPSSVPENQLHLAEWSSRFEPLIRAAGAEPVLYMVWPSLQRFADFPAVRDSYRKAAARVGGIFSPGGDAWLAAWDVTPALGLYGSDQFHPSPAGTYLAALTLLGRLRGVDPTTLPARIPHGDGYAAYTESTVVLFQNAAKAALARNPARPTS
jgi:hypothetical protein